MAGAEARAVWQRAINRYIVQEDAKRAPKLACCQSASTKPVDGKPSNPDDQPDRTSSDAKPLSGNPLPGDTTRWLQAQHIYESPNTLTLDQMIAMEFEKENLKIGVKNFEVNKPCDHGIFYGHRSERNIPWWRATSVDNIADLVSKTSLQILENCDLPPPQKTHIRKFKTISRTNGDQEQMYLNWERQKERNNTMKKHSYECDMCKDELLEALRHSQTRAREAEEMAKQAFAEKDDIVKLFLRQASQLFAYKQWFRILQIETLFDQPMGEENDLNTLFSATLPCFPEQGNHVGKKWHKFQPRKSKKHEIGKYAVVFALGLSLVGAGLLLGWTVAWMLPF